jgi:hypothetical protein
VTNHPIARLKFDEARELAHLAAIYQDLGFAVQATKTLAELLRSGTDNPILQRSLFTAALVAYVRCFSSGKRVSLSPDIFASLPGEPLVCHQQYKDTRDKHIAHSVNPFEEMLVGAVLAPPESEQKVVEGVACLTATLQSYDADGVEQLGRLALFAQQHVGRQCKALEQHVLEVAKTLDIADLYRSVDNLRITPQGGPDAAASKRSA